MAPRIEHLKGELVDRVAEIIRTRLSGAKAAAAESFARQYYANVPPADIANLSPEILYGAALCFWQFGQTRLPGEQKVRVFNPRLEEHGWKTSHSVIEVITDNMPFLVDSLTAELNRRGYTVHLVIHPIMYIVRDDAGALSEIVAPVDDKRFAETPGESYMHFQVDEQTSTEALERIEAGVVRVLNDVRLAVEDWRAMTRVVADLTESIANDPPKLPGGEVDEGVEFLRWIADNQLTFLGYREMKVSGSGAMLRVEVQPGGLGILRDPDRDVMETWVDFAGQPQQIRDSVASPTLINVNKANRRSTVHRPVHLDVLMVKAFDGQGKVTGIRMIVGLFTSAAYSRSPHAIPLLRRKVAHALELAGFEKSSHDGKALAHILETYPRDELLQMTDEELLANAMGILHLQERQRVSLFVRQDSFERFVTALVFVPRERYNSDLRKRFEGILAHAFDGHVVAFYPQLATDSVLAQVLFIVKTVPGAIPAYALDEIEASLVEAGRSWSDKLQQALVEEKGEERGLLLYRAFGEAFDAGYRNRYTPAEAIRDVEMLEGALETEALGINLYRPIEDAEHKIRLKLFHVGSPITLSDVLPMMEHMGLRVVAENPFRAHIAEREATAWIHDFELLSRDGAAIDLGAVKDKFQSAFARVWRGEVEDDGFNRLVISAGLGWRQVVVLRAYCKYLRQARIAFSQDYMEDTLAANPGIAQLIVELFETRFDPKITKARADRHDALKTAIEGELENVANLDEDRILRRFVNLVDVTLRSNFFQTDEEGALKPYVSFKFDSQSVDELPPPRPWREVFVYSPRMEGVHLRGGPVARGGIRWSDRREDFRTEILGLVKAQMVKNAVIVPVGSKGGFVCKRLPSGDREALMAEVVDCYKTLMRGLLDITDNLKGADVVPPKNVVRHDGDDPYLVVAADKGTATFSDIANGVSQDYGFWLGDAFASGGSAGYDHKKMGITARGAWESVKRHFREMGVDTQSQPFSVVGCGDMSGDVFGNGMLLSEHIRLVGAFNHLHIFVDPEPDIAASFRERQRLFALPRSSWIDYEAKLISKGGGVFDRKAKAIKVTPEMKTLFAVDKDSVTPNALIRAMLGADVDLLWFGGIGTYVKAAAESDAEAGDRANDPLRLDGRDIKAKVIGEGANLGVTQRGRIEFAAKGGRINTDFIDNSAGVDCSDHEVNIKILLDDVVANGDMTLKQRNKLLEDMTDEVSRLVLADNYLQTQAISQATSRGWVALDVEWRMMRALERAGRLDRTIEFLPDDEGMAERRAERVGLTRPEYAVLFSYAKIVLYDELLPTELPDVPYLAQDIARYFLKHLRQKYADKIARHRLKREIVATYITNSMVNRMGAAFAYDMQARSGLSSEDVARAYTIARDAFELRPVWRDIEALDNKVPAEAQIAMSERLAGLVERGTMWFLRNGRHPLDIEATIGAYGPGIAEIAGKIGDMLTPADRTIWASHADQLTQQGVPKVLAQQVASLEFMVPACDVVRIADRSGTDVATAGGLYFALGAQLGIDWARHAARAVKAETEWQKLAVGAIVDDSYGHQAELTAQVLDGGAKRRKKEAVDKVMGDWLDANRAQVDRTNALFGELRTAPEIDIAMLTVANRQLRTLVAG